MTLELITKQWRPSKKTSDTLKSEKYGYTQEQVNKLGYQFIDRYMNKQIHDASTTFFNFVRSSGVGYNMPEPDREIDVKFNKERANNFANKSDNSVARIKQLRDTITYKIGEEQLRANLAMIQTRFGWSAAQADEWLERELRLDSFRKERNKKD